MIAPPPTLSLRQINRATLARQMLLGRERTPPLRAIERLVALQAQWPRPPFVGLWSRLQAFERNDLAALLARGKAVRATLLRGTLHVCSAKDYLALRRLMQPVLDAGLQSILRQRGASLDVAGLTEEARGILAPQPLTFEDLRDRLKRLHPKADERAMGYAVRMSLPLVMVPEGREWSFPAQSRFALAETWLKGAVPRETPSPQDLVLRYLAAYGPARAADVQAWSGLPKLQDAFESLRPRLATFRDEGGRELFDLPKAPRPDGDVAAPVRFVPEYDNLVTTRADERCVALKHRPRVYLSALRIAATVLVDGFAAATWKVETKRGVATVAVAPFAAFSPRIRKEVEGEAEALAHFVEPEARRYEVQLARP